MSDLATTLQLDVGDLEPEPAAAALINHVAKLGASDLFFAAHENHSMVQMRHHGLLRAVTHLSRDHGKRIINHIKSVAGMNVAERRRPQDGRWIIERPEQPALDLRINIVPTLFGEDMTLRLLDRTNARLEIDQLGLGRRQYNMLLSMLTNPGGMMLVTGPTGSGKTTTLYACLNYLNDGSRKINTIEDPVEYAIGGIRQSQVNPVLDVTFAELLRNVLRQAPDVIMIGEIRDPETAEVAVRAANSGHLVLATLHAPSAVGAIESMIHLGANPHFLSQSLRGVISQRLVRTLCPECRQPYDLADAPHTFDEIRSLLEPGEGGQLFGPKGCDGCRHLGYAGRTGVFEVLTVGPALRQMILERASAKVLRTKAVEEGLVVNRLAAILKVARGETSIEEVFRAIPAEYLTDEQPS